MYFQNKNWICAFIQNGFILHWTLTHTQKFLYTLVVDKYTFSNNTEK